MKPNKTIYKIDLTHPLAKYMPKICATINPDYTNLIIKSVNDKQYPVITAMGFPNPYANNMINNFPVFKEIMGLELSQTVIDYNSADDKQVAAILFPDASLRALPDYEKLLDKATLNDLRQEVTTRQELIKNSKLKDRIQYQ